MNDHQRNRRTVSAVGQSLLASLLFFSPFFLSFSFLSTRLNADNCFYSILLFYLLIQSILILCYPDIVFTRAAMAFVEL